MTPELEPTVFLEPASGWARFTSSNELTDLFWETLSAWHYLNFTSGSSMWECRDCASLVWLEFDENDAIIESGFRLAQDRHDACALPALFDQIGAMFGVTPRP